MLRKNVYCVYGTAIIATNHRRHVGSKKLDASNFAKYYYEIRSIVVYLNLRNKCRVVFCRVQTNISKVFVSQTNIVFIKPATVQCFKGQKA